MNGDHHYDARKGLLLWTIDLIDKTNSSGAMEFVASPAAPPDSFFPVEVRCFCLQQLVLPFKLVTWALF